ncbi:acetyl-CoA hydrolase/transferase family protein [Clostridium aminobutyricum]|uniref:Acetyl-CoA hydrolase/transferase family protein n=1 Tax=Clostridium aminobutyricum TaxID=33953 RepID=A0A939D9A5_CLOAM|nr:acetyl-CoA hydrolase/transferase C-terminal domain-containing protein [Clostridium aminobutyricum]MBN7773567.1 acetyl-CoA hydrolase/transferase family protein [Clostridium aminobutyricum]
MSWQERYKSKLTTSKEAVTHIKSGDTVLLSHAVSEPTALVEAMVENCKAYRDVVVSHMISLGRGAYSKPEMREHFRYVGLFTDKATRASIHEGQGDFIPVYFSEIPEMIKKRRLAVDVFMVMVSPPDENGICCVGVSCDYTMQAIKSAKTVIAQINKYVPKVGGEAFVHIDEFDYIVEVSSPLPEVKWAETTEADLKIGQYCASLVEDGSTLQLGMGGIPNAVLASLKNKRNLGIHSEMISDGVVDLYEEGIINCSEKSIDKDKMVVNFLYGTKKLYDFVNNNPAVELRCADYTNNPLVIRESSKFVCINSAIEVDLWGQVNAGSIHGKIFSGVGGQVDFIRGAAMSTDGKGKAIIAMHATTTKKDGTKVSKIVGSLSAGTLVTTSQHDVDYVITEFGIAELKWKTVKERSRSLIAIADPDFREELSKQFELRFNEKC